MLNYVGVPEKLNTSIASPELVKKLAQSTKMFHLDTGARDSDGLPQVLPVAVIVNRYGENGDILVHQQAGFGYGINPSRISKDWGINPTKDNIFRAVVAAMHNTSAMTIGLPGAIHEGALNRNIIDRIPKGTTTQLTKEQREALREGDSGPIARAMAHVALQAAYLTGERVSHIPIGSSLTTGIVPSVATEIVRESGKLKGIGLIEPVGLPDEFGKASSLLPLGHSFARSATESEHLLGLVHKLYTEANSSDLTLSEMVVGLLKQKNLVRLLTSGNTFETYDDDMISHLNTHNIPTVVAFGDSSKFPNIENNVMSAGRRLVDDRGLNPNLFVTQKYPGIGHGLSVSAGAYVEIIGQVLGANSNISMS